MFEKRIPNLGSDKNNMNVEVGCDINGNGTKALYRGHRMAAVSYLLDSVFGARLVL